MPIDLDRLKTSSEIASSWVTILGLAVGALWAVQEYRDQSYKTQIERSLMFFNRFASEEYVNARLTLFEVFDRNLGALESDVKESLSVEEQSRSYAGHVLEMVSENGLTQVLLRLSNLFEEVVVCVDAQLCDRSTVERLLGVEGKAFFRTWAPYFCRLRESYRHPALSLEAERFFNSAGAGQACPAAPAG